LFYFIYLIDLQSLFYLSPITESTLIFIYIIYRFPSLAEKNPGRNAILQVQFKQLRFGSQRQANISLSYLIIFILIILCNFFILF